MEKKNLHHLHMKRLHMENDMHVLMSFKAKPCDLQGGGCVDMLHKEKEEILVTSQPVSMSLSLTVSPLLH